MMKYRLFRDLPRNSRVTLLLEPYSAVLACILMFYGTLYMQANGLGARQIGLITTLAAVTGLVNQIVAAPVVNRLGRRRALLLFSFICWSIPLLLWTLASGFTLFLLAALIFSFSRIASVAWYCVITEDVDDGRKSEVFGLVFIIASIGGVATAFAGPVIERFGLVPSVRFLYGFAFVSMTIMFIVRHRLLTETTAGAELNSLHSGMTLDQTFRHCLNSVGASLKDRALLRLTLAYVFFSFAIAMSFVQILFINNVLKLTLPEISLIPPAAAVASVVLFRSVVPRIREANERAAMAASATAFAAGMGLLLLIPVRQPGPVLLAAALAAGGSYLFQVVVNSAMNNRMAHLHKADVYSAIQLATALICIPAGYLAGSAFAFRPWLAVGAIALVGMGAGAVILCPEMIRMRSEAERDRRKNCGLDRCGDGGNRVPGRGEKAR